MVGNMKKAPWKDFKGNDIYEGDTIVHPDGDKGIVRYKPVYQSRNDNWLIDYGNFVSRLCLQIGDKGQAVVENLITTNTNFFTLMGALKTLRGMRK